jgi:hypothetical protein
MFQKPNKLFQPAFRINKKAPINKPTGNGNILSRLQLIPRQHNKLDAALPEGINGLGHKILQPILNPGGPHNIQPRLQFLCGEVVDFCVERVLFVGEPEGTQAGFCHLGGFLADGLEVGLVGGEQKLD